MEASLYSRVGDKVVCQLCWRFCKLGDGEEGHCRVRRNEGGKIFTTTYGKLSHLESRPIEIKPFFHFLPGSTSMTFSTYSCNFDCPWCQNWSISKATPPEALRETSPEEVVDLALIMGDKSTCASLNEPTLLYEYLLDVFRLAREKGLKNTMVSNGYMSILALKNLKNAGLDAINIDVKGDERVYRDYCNAEVEYVWRVIEKATKLGIHVEVVCLLVSNVVDEEVVREIVREHLRRAGSSIPIHFTRYFPAYRFTAPPTRIEFLEWAVKHAYKEGAEFAYIGNVPGHRFENTHCPDCGELLIRRYSFSTVDNRIRSGCCPKCGREIYGVWV
ncbi:AmmeMemoRadiSam system radical SAM enzyme [Archaeoglobus fulgidus]|uniref:Pyruvate formate-lyase activating enzyme (Act-4) n=3 Tax=Archaeoglobus fulgidus TaxID=2234 RepID=O28006_ARCFU|nr:AmmeMemoRadiSam system radical SAM enzyme [Archaeoglobus fulgidus]AAB88976.1 pyruvate formate-lyase activating enzyme (act-4) [Archaeoglobus fulgidus DSM 4304]AIG99288.1 Pyruvate-formate lyase-activating enzyme [Archaeoglobus fulgidus DSM 8774]KUJ92822.1 MAG: Pyruvate formate-lyase activating enzyme (Act-4) [Archaeoglobus fulgidus]KUK06284.1 MAG: Pyruvate formate-lyase activating enzyme (Act-4) [Archaeoglobus fulgidus]